MMRLPINWLTTFAAGLWMLLSSVADADILKCKDASGQVTYTENSCPPGTQPVTLSGSVAKSRASEPALSPRAAEFRKKAAACSQGDGSVDCRQFRAMVVNCRQPADHDTPDCVAIREVSDASARETFRRFDTALMSDKEKCSAGDKETCDRMVCPLTKAIESSWEEIRACSRYRSLPSTAQWAQVREGLEGLGESRRWAGDYLCVRQIQFKGDTGDLILVRHSFTVRAATIAGRATPGFQVLDFGKQIYPTKVAAVEAGCAADKPE